MNKRTEIYGTHLNHHVKNTILYHDADSLNLYFDAEFTNGVTREQLIELFMTGVLVRSGEDIMAPCALMLRDDKFAGLTIKTPDDEIDGYSIEYVQSEDSPT